MKDKKTISQSFQVRLAIIVAIALVVSTLLVFIITTFINKNNYSDIITSTLIDVEKDIEDTSDANMLSETKRIKTKVTLLLNTLPLDDVIGFDDALRTIVKDEDLSEISIANKQNIVIYSSHDEYIGFDMNSSPDTMAFDVLNHGTKEVVQPVRKNAYSGEGKYAEYNKYAGVPLEDVGYLQVAINPQQFQKQIDNQITYIAANRHVGQSGMVIISNIEDKVVSYAGADDTYVGVSLMGIGITFDKEKDIDTVLTFNINGVKHLAKIKFIEGYYIIGAVPETEVQSFRNRVTIIIVATEVVIFLLMFLFISKMINSIIVSKIHNVNNGLQHIIEGELDTKIDEYSTKEFVQLSNDINSTVTSLKDYMEREQEKVKQELEFAKSIQLGSLPKLGTIEKYNQMFDLYATMDTAKEVGGDFYDFYVVDDSKLAFLIADVSGKGVPAAMFMMTCKTMLKNLVDSGLSLSEAFTKANDALLESNDAEMFVTVWMGLLNLKTGDVEFINAGHNPPLIYNDNEGFKYLKAKSGFVLTGIEGLKYKVQTAKLNKGDKIFLYTDGATEAKNLSEELYGEARLLEYVNSVKEKPMKDILLGVKGNIDVFVGEAQQFDDITMVGLRYDGWIENK